MYRTRSHDGFERPEKWSVFVDWYREVLRTARISADSVVVDDGTYIDAHEQVRLMDLNRIAANYIGMWIKKRCGGEGHGRWLLLSRRLTLPRARSHSREAFRGGRKARSTCSE